MPVRREQGFIAGIDEGWKFVVRERPVFYIMAIIAIFSLFGIPYITMLPVLAVEVLDVGVKGLSVLMSAAGIGSFAAAMIVAYKGEIEGKGIYIPAAAIVFSAAIMVISLSVYGHHFFCGMGHCEFSGGKQQLYSAGGAERTQGKGHEPLYTGIPRVSPARQFRDRFYGALYRDPAVTENICCGLYLQQCHLFCVVRKKL
jgi:hypothetical protein